VAQRHLKAENSAPPLRSAWSCLGPQRSSFCSRGSAWLEPLLDLFFTTSHVVPWASCSKGPTQVVAKIPVTARANETPNQHAKSPEHNTDSRDLAPNNKLDEMDACTPS
jgi:hypothetical protein